VLDLDSHGLRGLSIAVEGSQTGWSFVRRHADHRPKEIEEAMEKDQLLARLNEDLELEFRSIVQYTQHLATVKGMEFQPIAEMIRPHLKEELEHAVVLAEQIDFLGGTPTTRVPEVPSETDSKSAFELDLDLEEQQLAGYRERFEQVQEMGLPDVAEALRPLLEQTQDHVRDLRGALGR
jgi:bacterioferritin